MDGVSSMTLAVRIFCPCVQALVEVSHRRCTGGAQHISTGPSAAEAKFSLLDDSLLQKQSLLRGPSHGVAGKGLGTGEIL